MAPVLADAVDPREYSEEPSTEATIRSRRSSSSNRPFSKLPPIDAGLKKPLSLDVALQPYNGMTPDLAQPVRPSSALPVSPASAPPTMSTASTLAQSNNFLVVLAAQERRVMELKEELQRAEAELSELKRQWTVREARRKRDDARQVKQLEALSTARTSVYHWTGNEPGSALVDHARKKAMSVGSRPSGRKVLAGQKHTRALSLLSADSINQGSTTARPDRHVLDGGPRKHRSRNSTDAYTPRANPTHAVSYITSVGTKPSDLQTKEALFRTGRQMAEDFKDGLWSFFDDIRQATVGEESVYGPQARQTQGNTPVKSHGTRGRAPRPRDHTGPSPGPGRDKNATDGSRPRRSHESVPEKEVLIAVTESIGSGYDVDEKLCAETDRNAVG